MADRQGGFSATMVVVVVLVLAVLAVAAWRAGLFERDSDAEATYQAGVTDESGGELIVTDPETPQVEDLKLPETPMTPVPPRDQASAAADGQAAAE